AASSNLVDFQNGLDLNGVNRDVVVNGGQARLSGVISNGGINKYGAGTLEVTNANTYDVFTLVQQGRLLVNNATGSATGTSAIELQDGATLGGGGKIVGASNVYAAFGSRIDPGGSAGRTLGIQTSSGGVMTFNSTWVVHINATGTGSVPLN